MCWDVLLLLIEPPPEISSVSRDKKSELEYGEFESELWFLSFVF